jgi:predicted TIM-barrel fold metal-dependent hydrolase
VVDPERAVQEVAALDLRPESLAALMRENALRVFKLPESSSLVIAETPS